MKGIKWRNRLALFLSIPVPFIFLPPLAKAQGEGDADTPVTDYLSPVAFASFTGQVMFVLLVVQFIKLPIDQKLGKVRTEYIVYGVALLAQVLAQAMLYGYQSFTLAFIPKCIAYSFLVAVTAKEAYVKAIGNIEARKASLKASEQKNHVEQ